MLQLMQSNKAPVASETGLLNRKWREIRFSLEKRSLERKLESILNASGGHESNSLPVGAPEYKLLSNEADSLVEGFAARWSLDTDSLRAKIPGLSKLEGLSTRSAPMNYAKLTGLGVVAIPLVCFLVGTVAGLVSLGFHLVGGR
jgi:hypothetical protein